MSKSLNILKGKVQPKLPIALFITRLTQPTIHIMNFSIHAP